jgi:hypothetical protein
VDYFAKKFSIATRERAVLAPRDVDYFAKKFSIAMIERAVLTPREGAPEPWLVSAAETRNRPLWPRVKSKVAFECTT